MRATADRRPMQVRTPQQVSTATGHHVARVPNICDQPPMRSEGSRPTDRVCCVASIVHVTPFTAICSGLPVQRCRAHPLAMGTKSRETIYGSSARAAAEREGSPQGSRPARPSTPGTSGCLAFVVLRSHRRRVQTCTTRQDLGCRRELTSRPLRSRIER